jgi:hypothetical protein
MNILTSPIEREIEKVTPIKNAELSRELEAAGFTGVASRVKAEFPRITVEAIRGYLDRLLYAHIESNKLFKIGRGPQWLRDTSLEYLFTREMTIRHHRLGGNYILSAKWAEDELGRYDGIPPMHILKTAQKYKDEFALRIVTCRVEEREVIPISIPDPLLIGIKDNDRFLLDWWEKDIDPMELIGR